MRFSLVVCSVLALSACSETVNPITSADSGADASAADAPAVDAPAVDMPVAVDRPSADVPTDAPRTCRAQRDCGPAEECYGNAAGCGITWTCVPRLGRACAAQQVAFCGCDGRTFVASSTCPSAPYAFVGSCGGPPPACVLPGGGMCPVGMTCPAGDGCNTCTCGAGGTLACTERGCVDGGTDASVDVVRDVPADVPTSCRLPTGARCPVGATCPAGDGCNDCTCTAPDALMCTARPCAFDAGPMRPNCTNSRECMAGAECAGGDGCATPWTCRPATGRLCTDDVVPYCGCDGRTFYGSSSCPPSPFSRRGACGDGGV